MDCQHVFARGQHAGKACTSKGLHGGYCIKHKKAAVPQEIIDAVGPPPAAPKQKSKFSAWKWTVNSNTPATKATPAQVGEFKDLIAFMFSPANVVDYLRDATNADAAANVIELQSAFHFEIAPTTHALHAHGAVKLEHKGHYRLALKEMRAILVGLWGKKVHFDVHAEGNAERAWDQYMAKNAAADKA